MNLQPNIWGSLAETAAAIEDVLKRIEGVREGIGRDPDEFAPDARRQCSFDQLPADEGGAVALLDRAA